MFIKKIFNEFGVFIITWVCNGETWRAVLTGVLTTTVIVVLSALFALWYVKKNSIEGTVTIGDVVITSKRLLVGGVDAKSGKVVDPLYDQWGRQQIAGFSAATGVVMTQDVSSELTMTIETMLANQKSIPDRSTPINVNSYNKKTFYVNLENIKSAVEVYIETSPNNEVWAESLKKVFDGNGLKEIQLNNSKHKYIRVSWKSEKSQPHALVTVWIIAGN